MKKNSTIQDEYVLTPKEALELLSISIEKRKKRVHSVEYFFGARMGCNIDLTTIKKYFDEAISLFIVGPSSRDTSHAVVYELEGKGYIFLETDQTKLKALYKLRKLKK